MRCSSRIPAWSLLLVAVLGILSGRQSLCYLERLANQHHTALSIALGIELKHSPSDTAFRCVFLQMDMATLCAAIRDWAIAETSRGANERKRRQSLSVRRGSARAGSLRSSPADSETVAL